MYFFLFRKRFPLHLSELPKEYPCLCFHAAVHVLADHVASKICIQFICLLGKGNSDQITTVVEVFFLKKTTEAVFFFEKNSEGSNNFCRVASTIIVASS